MHLLSSFLFFVGLFCLLSGSFHHLWARKDLVRRIIPITVLSDKLEILFSDILFYISKAVEFRSQKKKKITIMASIVMLWLRYQLMVADKIYTEHVLIYIINETLCSRDNPGNLGK